MPQPNCEEKTRLLFAYQWSAERYSKVLELAKKVDSKLEYRQLCSVIEQVRNESVEARNLLERHLAEHGC